MTYKDYQYGKEDKKNKKKEARKCLGLCGKFFFSEGKHNRICNDCKQSVAYKGDAVSNGQYHSPNKKV